MRIREIYLKTRNLVTEPLITWNQIYEENKLKSKLIQDFLIPIAFLVGLSSFLGEILGGNIHDFSTFSYLIVKSIISFSIVFIEVYLASWIIAELAVRNDSSIDTNKIFNLVTYSHTPFILSLAFVKVLPQLYFFNLVGLYSLYVLWTGIYLFTGFRAEKKVIFLILSILLTFTIYFSLGAIFNWIYDGIINEFTNFVSQL